MQNGENGLIDIQGVRVDGMLPVPTRIERFARAVGNPYHFRVGATSVRIEYAGSASIAEKLARMLE